MRENAAVHIGLSISFSILSLLWNLNAYLHSENDPLFAYDLTDESMADHALDAFNYMHDPNVIVCLSICLLLYPSIYLTYRELLRA